MTLPVNLFQQRDGESITGRVPSALWVDGGGGLTEGQEAAVGQLYQQFAAEVRASLADNHISEHVLIDGSQVRMESAFGIDKVTVWPAPTGLDKEALPHGFAVVTNWQRPRIYKRNTTDEPAWSVDAIQVPQVKEGDTIFDNQVFRPIDDKNVNHPMVFNLTKKRLWDYLSHSAATVAADKLAVPFRLKAADADGYTIGEPHYAWDDKIVKADDTVLYEMPPTAAILVVDPETIQYLPACSDSNGDHLVMQHYRLAVIAPMTGISKFRFCSERLVRADASTYTVEERKEQDLIVPVDAQTVTTLSASYTDLDEDVDGELHFTIMYGTTDGTSSFTTGYVFDVQSLASVTRRDVYEQAFRDVLQQTAGDATETTLVAVGGEADIEYVPLVLELNYPREMNWRMGGKATGIFTSDFVWTGDRYYVSRFEKKRIDLAYSIDGSPSVVADLGWKEFQVLGGTTTGSMSGHRYEDIMTHGSHIDFGRTGVTEAPYAANPASPYYVHPDVFWSWLAANDILGTTLTDIAAEYGTGANTVTVVDEERPANSGSYTLTSRHMIDYDHRGRFAAWIRVEVDCSGAMWVEDRDVFDGHMVVGEDPTYHVRIWFECEWGVTGAVDSQLLADFTASRPAFEFEEIEKINPYYFFFPALSDRSTFVRMPPSPTPPVEAINQFLTLTHHQGVNTRVACEDVRTGIVDGASDVGIEFSTVRNGAVYPHRKYVTGQLYARTFKLLDLPDALWLLSALKVDAVEDDFIPLDEDPPRPAWFYMPELGALIENDTFHIEVRDGVIVDWSEDIPGDKPALDEREISLYRV